MNAIYLVANAIATSKLVVVRLSFHYYCHCSDFMASRVMTANPVALVTDD